METPSYSHLTSKDYDHVYEPSQDSFLLLDALELELPFLKSQKPLICAEIGSGSGIIISALAKYLNYQSHGFFAIDINNYACDATNRTAKANCVNVDVINMDLLSAFNNNSIDLLIFNPPYVPTPSFEASDVPEHKKLYDKDAEIALEKDKMLIKSWAGGIDGYEVTNRVISNLDKVLSPSGIFYLLLLKQNNPERIKKQLRELGFKSEQIIERKIPGEHLFVLKIFRNLNLL